MEFENSLQLGNGVYTPAEIAQIIRMPYHKVHRWIDKYWDGRLGKVFESSYSWKTENSRAVSFHTLIELNVMLQFAEVGVSTREVLKAHGELSKRHNTAFPFATKQILQSIHTEGRKIYLGEKENLITLDGSNQLNLPFIQRFFKNIDFNAENLATRFWPMGRDRSILIDPDRKFGHPVINERNIYPETIYNHIKAGDPVKYICHIYELSEVEVEDAINYCKAA